LKRFLIVLFLIFIAISLYCGEKKKTTDEKANTAPTLRSVSILPEKPVQGSRVTLHIEASDNEGDKINYQIKWFLNDKVIGEGFELFLNEAKRNDKIFAEITPDDGKLTGEPIRTPTITIGNTPPIITKATINPDTIFPVTEDLTVVGEGFDPDGDALKWLCYWVLDYKERIADSSLTVNLKQLNLKKGSHLTAELYANDGDTVSMPYLLEIDVVNSPPVLKVALDSIPYKTDSLFYELPITDPDGDPLTFELLKAPEGINIEPKKGILYGLVNDTTTFEILVRAKDADGAYLDARFTLTPPRP